MSLCAAFRDIFLLLGALAGCFVYGQEQQTLEQRQPLELVFADSIVPQDRHEAMFTTGGCIPNNKVTLTPRCSRRRWSGVSRTRFRFQPLFMRRAAGLSNSCDSRERPSATRKGACTTQPRGRTKKFTYRLEHDETDPKDFEALVSTNLLGFLYITQRTVKEMLKQKSGCVVSITAALADRPIAGVDGSVSMMTKGGLNSATQNLAIEYAKDGIRFNAVAPGVVDTPMHRDDPNDSTLQPTMKKATVRDIVDAVLTWRRHVM